MTPEQKHAFHLKIMGTVSDALKNGHTSHPSIMYMVGELEYAKHALISSANEAKVKTTTTNQ